MAKKMSLFYRILSVIGLYSMLGLGACGTNQPVTLPVYDTSEFQSIRLDARRLEIIENWKMPMAPPFIEHTLSPNLSSMMVDWASRVLVPVGGSGEVILDISQASVKVTELPKSEKLFDVFKDNQETMMRADIKAKLLWIQPVGGRQGIIDLTASASVTVRESATPNERDVAAREIMIQAIELINKQALEEVQTIEGLIRP